MCCGTHVNNLSDIQCVKLLHTELKKGMTLLYFVTGDRVLQYLQRCTQVEKELTKLLRYTFCSQSINHIYLYSSIYLSIHQSNHPSIYPSISLSTHLSSILSTHSFIYLSINLSTHLFIYPSINLSTHLSIYPSVYPPIHIYPSIHLSIYCSTGLDEHTEAVERTLKNQRQSAKVGVSLISSFINYHS